ncbi:nucleotidyltransferase family protein [Prolixibacteraceae bacterium Z1-6]|uniref:Nucleotidyltransferase family protein n=1 Tax=Draconibacterium aestuarii TaxID=2998507 RepID=A0A9X3F8G4_9BACT|nr:nucleotidyltransferase family protein [Prolixibacteraceae bacterium Z1-6]
MKAMLFAAGLGTRLQNETASKPKALVEIGGKTLLQRAIEKLKAEGVEEIVVNVHHFSKLVIDFIESKDWGIPVHISDESDKLLETGGGLKKAVPFFTGNSPVLIYNVDILSNLNLKVLKEEHLKSGALATVVVRQRKTERYFKFDQNKNLVGWLNKKTGETIISVPDNFEEAVEMAFSGIHIIQPELFQFMPEEDRFSIVQVYLELAKTKKIKGYFDNSDLWIDVGKPAKLAEARELFK